ncbi:AT-rich interactive domain-containing protein 3B isoform X1 [Alosa pseudoharengus]|uniref:AT-rich interactive domain-containing protein 3B isoform X1 n=1 Tax=Alosa pseudoharengus TaxID=34774 RepID=UPI003F89D04A
MVDNSSSSKAQMTSLSQEGSLSGGFSQAGLASAAGVKLEAVMEQLQKQQQAKLEMEHKERHLREAQILYAQQVAAQQAILANARAQGGPLPPEFYGKNSRDRALKVGMGHQANRVATQSSVDSMREEEEDEDDDDDEEDDMERRRGSEGEEDEDEEMVEGEEGSEEDEGEGLEFLRKQSLALQQAASGVTPFPFPVYSASASPSAAKKRPRSPSTRVKDEPEDKSLSPAGPHSFSTPNGMADWGFDESFKQNGSAGWSEEGDGGRGAKGEASRDFAKLYELDSDPNRKEFLDDLFTFMQKRGTPVNRIPIMAKQVLDLYKLFKLVTEKGGLVEVINKKIWREITKGLNLPTSITSAAFTLRTQYMKYLYPYECEKKGLSSPGELQAAIDSNRREGRRPSYSNSLYRFSTSPSGTSHILTPPKVHLPSSAHNGLQESGSPALKKGTVPEEGPASMLPGRLPLALALGHQQQLARAATLEQLRERLETGMGMGAGVLDGQDRSMARLAEEQHRLLQQAFQHNLLAMASQVNPAGLHLGVPKAEDKQDKQKQDMSLSISSNGSTSITVSVEVNGTVYTGTLYAQKVSGGVPTCSTATPAGQSGSPNVSSSSKGPSLADPPSCTSP